jgi:ABC-type glutathione transport system ATPase component
LPLGAVSPFSHRLEKLQVRQFTQATLTEEKLSLLESVILVDDEVAGLEILSRQGKRPALWVQHKTLGYVPLYALGDGVRRVLAIALGLIEAQNGVLLIDEIETAIHMSALSGVFRWLVRAAAAYNVQLFATTHSLEAVDAILSAERDQLSDVAIFRLPPPGSGRTVAGYKGMDAYSMRHNSGMELR